MAARQTSGRRAYSYNRTTRQAYVYGNVAAQPEYEPRRRKEEPKRRKKVSHQVRKNRKKALHMSQGYVIFLAVAAICALLICVNYVNLQSKITKRSKNITAMQEELAGMREENTTRYNAVMDSVNLEEVRKNCTGEAGGWSMRQMPRSWNIRSLLLIM